MTVTATHINYYFICRRKLWLFANGINMEHTSAAVAEGKLIHDISYQQRAQKYTEIEIGGSKIDFYDARNRVIHEVKKGDKMEEAHEWQVKYYIWLLQQHGVDGVRGVIEYPRLRETKGVELDDADKAVLAQVGIDIKLMANAEVCPPVINKPICRKCPMKIFAMLVKETLEMQ